MQALNACRLQKYPLNYHWTFQFQFGLLLFCIGVWINIHSDTILRNLRKPGEHGYKIPRGMYFIFYCKIHGCKITGMASTIYGNSALRERFSCIQASHTFLSNNILTLPALISLFVVDVFVCVSVSGDQSLDLYVKEDFLNYVLGQTILANL